MHALRKWLGRIDTGVFHVERVLLLVSLFMMTLLVFSEVIVRTFTRPVGKTASMIIAAFSIEDPEAQKAVGELWGPVVFYVLMAGLCVFGAHSSRQIAAERKGEGGPAVLGSVLLGLAVCGGFVLTIQGMTAVFPTGVAGAQRFSLGFMVWAGLLGASIATRTRRHIMLDAVKKKLDAQIAPLFSLVGSIATALFCGALAYLSFYKLHGQVSEWLENPHIGVFDALPIPEWIVTLALPLSFSMIGLRFLAGGASDLLYGESLLSEEDEHGVNLEELEQQAAALSGEQPDDAAPAEAPERLYGRPHQGRAEGSHA